MARLHRSRTLITLLATAGSVNVAYTAVIPLVPYLHTQMGISLAAIGLSFTAFALARSVMQVFGGYLVDRLTARRVAVGALLVASVAIGGFAFSRTATDFVLWRLLWGAAEGVLTPALYRLGVLIAQERGIAQARLMGWFGSVAVVGMAIGPAAAGVTGTFLGFRPMFVLAAAATAVTALAAASFLRVEERSAATAQSEPTPDAPARRTSLRPMLIPIALFGGLDLVNNVLYAALEPLLPFTIGSIMGGGASATAAVFTWGLIVFAVVAGLGGGLAERVRPLPFAGIAFLLMAVCLAVIGQSAGIVSLAIAFTAFMALQPMLYIVARRGLSEQCEGQARAFGYFGSLSDVGLIIGPAIGTLFFSPHGGSAYLALSAIAVCVGLVYLGLGQRASATAPRTERRALPALTAVDAEK